MKKIFLYIVAVMIPILITASLIFAATTQDLAILNTGGEIARRQHEILSFAFWLSMVVIIPVFGLTIFISIRYRSKNKKAKYTPNWHHSKSLETIWWGVPIVLILILSAVTWRTSHTLDPYKPLDNDLPPLEVQVVALQWRWLFLYPEQNVAQINNLTIPKDRPINLTITSDAPMNSFWIPKLAGQVYAMNGMNTKLHIIADQAGSYDGMSANISGEGFAQMRFTTEVITDEEFDNWIRLNKYRDEELTQELYDFIAQPSEDDEVHFFAHYDKNLYQTILNKYMSHAIPTDYSNTPETTNGGHH
ncbi:ubiquinol oxidase subunit II [Candidatus Saccharibacteria bacterium]|nr:ubiquinol oxidase subunit II [Candidatus Saccharibacteria bacterium]